MENKIVYLFQQGLFKLRLSYFSTAISLLRKLRWTIMGMKIGSRTVLPKLYVTWPHQVSIGKDCILETDIYFKYDGIWKSGPSITIKDSVFIGKGCEFNINCGISIGSYTNIASGCKFIDHDHGKKLGDLIGIQESVKQKIFVEDDVWLGANVIVLKGVSIGKGAVIAAGAVVNNSIPSNEIWGGIPAKKIGIRTI